MLNTAFPTIETQKGKQNWFNPQKHAHHHSFIFGLNVFFCNGQAFLVSQTNFYFKIIPTAELSTTTKKVFHILR
jgi:hypothetical protein